MRWRGPGRQMTEDRSQGTDGPAGQPEPVQPWFPPPGQPGGPDPAGGGYGYPPGGGPGQPGGYGQQGGYGQPGGYGQRGGYGQPGYGRGGGGGWRPPPGPQAPKPGVIALRPLAVGEILDGAFTSIRRNPMATLGIAAVLLTISAVISATVNGILSQSAHGLGSLPPQPTPDQAASYFSRLAAVALPAAGLALVLAFVVNILLTGLLTAVIGRGVLGHKITPGEAWQLARPRLLALLGSVVLTVLCAAAPWAVLGGLLAVVAVAGSPGAGIAVIGVFGGIAALCLTIWFATMFQLAGPVVVLERLGPATALKRSWRLVRGSFWRVFGITLLAGLIVAVAATVLQLPFSLIAGFAGGAPTGPFGPGGAVSQFADQSITALIVTAIGSIVAGTVTRPVAAGVTVLLYVDLRMRREGLDLVLQSAASGGQLAGDEFASVWRPGGGPPPPAPPPGPGLSSGPGGTAPPPPAGTPPAW